MNQQSENINELMAALAKAQGEMSGASKDSKNPYFNSKYADLSSVWEAIREPLSKNGLCVIQTTFVDKEDKQLYLKTTLGHSSGQWISSIIMIDIPPIGATEIDRFGKEKKVNIMHSFGSTLTYQKRYALTSITGIAPIEEDDDGNASNVTPIQEKNIEPKSKTLLHKTISKEQADEFRSIVSKCSPKFKENIENLLIERKINGLHNLGENLHKTLLEKALKDMEQYQSLTNHKEQVAV